MASVEQEHSCMYVAWYNAVYVFLYLARATFSEGNFYGYERNSTLLSCYLCGGYEEQSTKVPNDTVLAHGLPTGLLRVAFGKNKWHPPLLCTRKAATATYSGCPVMIECQIALNLDVCISNSHVYGTVTIAVTVTVINGASHLHDNHLAMVVGRNHKRLPQR
jgi:hypothetical protein